MKKILILVAMIACFFVGLRTQESTYSKDRSANQAPKQLRNKDFGAWSYSAYRNDGRVQLTLSTSLDTLQKTNSFLKNNQANKNELFKYNVEAAVVIIPSRPLSFKDFDELVNKYGLKVKSYAIRAHDEHGMITTMFGVPEKDVLVPIDVVAQMQNQFQEQFNQDLTIDGIIAINGNVSHIAFDDLQKDILIHAIDTTPTLSINDLIKDGLIEPSEPTDITPSSIYWLALP